MVGLSPCRSTQAILCSLVVGIVLFSVGVPATAPAATLRTVALTGQQAPGTPGGVNFSNFALKPPVLNDAGQTTFGATLSGNGVTSIDQEGIWLEESGRPSLVVRTGQLVPGTPNGVRFKTLDFRPPLLNNAGEIAFVAWTEDGNCGIWTDRSGGLALVAGSRNQAPGTPTGVRFENSHPANPPGPTFYLYPSLNNAGEIAFSAFLSGNGVNRSNDLGIWSEGSGELKLLVRAGSAAPGAPSDVNFASFGLGPPVLNDAGQTAFSAFLDNGSSANSLGVGQGIWSDRSGSLAPIAQTGDRAPDTSSDVRFDTRFSTPALNNVGQTAFWASTNDGNSSIWSESSGRMAHVARSGSQAPGTPIGVSFKTFGDPDQQIGLPPALNDAGQVAFFATLVGSGVDETNNWGLWLGNPSDLALVARTGSQAPGMPIGATFSSVTLDFEPPALNNAGQVAFFGTVIGGDLDFDYGIWATDRTGKLQLIVRRGASLEVAPGDIRTVASLDGWLHPRALNNLGQLTFRAEFTDRTQGIFVSNIVAIPEPSSQILFGLAAVAVLLVHREQRSLARVFMALPRRRG